MNKEYRNLLIALSIGDGHIDKTGAIIVVHSSKQKEYVQYKLDLVRKYNSSVKMFERQSNGTLQYGFRIPATKYSKLLRRILYPDGKKTITKKLLNRIGLIGLSIWWGDDGSTSKKKNKSGGIKATVSTLSTQVSKEENQIIIDWFLETYGIRFGQRKMKNHYSLICGTGEGRKLTTLLLPYTIESMQYKLS